MTAKEAQEQCPALNVKICIGKTIYPAEVRGSMNEFATVWPNCGGSLMLGRFEYSWHAIAHAVTTGKPLRT